MNQTHDPEPPLHRERLLNLADDRADHPERLSLPVERPTPETDAEETADGEDEVKPHPADSGR